MQPSAPLQQRGAGAVRSRHVLGAACASVLLAALIMAGSPAPVPVYEAPARGEPGQTATDDPTTMWTPDVGLPVTTAVRTEQSVTPPGTETVLEGTERRGSRVPASTEATPANFDEIGAWFTAIQPTPAPRTPRPRKIYMKVSSHKRAAETRPPSVFEPMLNGSTALHAAGGSSKLSAAEPSGYLPKRTRATNVTETVALALATYPTDRKMDPTTREQNIAASMTSTESYAFMNGLVSPNVAPHYFARRLDGLEPPEAAFLAFGSGKRSRFAIVSAWSFDGRHRRSSDVAPAAIVNKVLYCRRHGYDLYLHDTEEVLRRAGYPSRHPQWAKPLVVAQLLPHYEWVIWHDIDILYMNFSFTYEFMINEFVPPTNGTILIGREWDHEETYINTAHVLYKRDAATAAILHWQFTMSPSTWGTNNDQDALQTLLRSRFTDQFGNDTGEKIAVADKIVSVSPVTLFGAFVFASFYSFVRFHYGDPAAHLTYCSSAVGCNAAIAHLFALSLSLNDFADAARVVPPRLLVAPRVPPELPAAGTFGHPSPDTLQTSTTRSVIVISIGEFIPATHAPTPSPPTTTAPLAATAAPVNDSAPVAAPPVPTLPPRRRSMKGSAVPGAQAAWRALCEKGGFAFTSRRPQVLFSWAYEPLVTPDNARALSLLEWLPYHDWALYVDGDVSPAAAIVADPAIIHRTLERLEKANVDVAVLPNASDSIGGNAADVSVIIARRSAWALNLLDLVFYYGQHESWRKNDEVDIATAFSRLVAPAPPPPKRRNVVIVNAKPRPPPKPTLIPPAGSVMQRFGMFRLRRNNVSDRLGWLPAAGDPNSLFVVPK